MNDMRMVIIPKSDQINADDLLAGPITVTITKVEIRPGTEQPVSIHFENDNGKPYKPCKSMARVMVHCWGPDANNYVGHSMTLYCDPKVMWGGMAVGGIRISHMTDIAATQVMALTATKGNKKPFTVKPLVMESPPLPDKYSSLIEPDGRKWMANLRTLLALVVTLEEIAEIEAASSVVAALETAPGAVKSEIRSMFAGARGRVGSPAPDFGEAPTTPADVESL